MYHFMMIAVDIFVLSLMKTNAVIQTFVLHTMEGSDDDKNVPLLMKKSRQRYWQNSLE